MTTALIIDLILAGILVFAALLGAGKGLYKCLMSFLSVIIAIVAAAFLTNMFADSTTEKIFPQVEKQVVEAIAKRTGDISLESVGLKSIPKETLDSLGEWLSMIGIDPVAIAEELTSTAENAITTAARSIVGAAVRAVMFLVLFVVMKLVATLLLALLGHAFDLPVLKQVNRLGGALLAMVEAALLIFLAIYVAPRVGCSWFNDHAEETVLLAWFMKYSPYTLIMTLCSTLKAAKT